MLKHLKTTFDNSINTEYMILNTVKQVLENGFVFKRKHFYMILETLSYEELQHQNLKKLLKIIADYLHIDFSTLSKVIK